MKLNHYYIKCTAFVIFLGLQLSLLSPDVFAQSTHDVGITAKVSDDAKVVNFYLTVPEGMTVPQGELYDKVAELALSKEHFLTLTVELSFQTIVLEVDADKVSLKEVKGLAYALGLDLTTELTDQKVKGLVKEKIAQN